MARRAFEFDVSKVMQNLNLYSAKMLAGLELYGRVAASKMETYARTNAIWIDRTAHARQSIRGSSYLVKDNLVIAVAGGMEYSPYLEFANDKAYAILYPTLQTHQDAILAGLKNVMR